MFPMPPPLNLIGYFIKLIKWLMGQANIDRIGIVEKNNKKNEINTYNLILGKILLLNGLNTLQLNSRTFLEYRIKLNRISSNLFDRTESKVRISRIHVYFGSVSEISSRVSLYFCKKNINNLSLLNLSSSLLRTRSNVIYF